MAVLFLLCFAAFLFFGAGILAFSLSIIGTLWRAAEVMLNGLVGGAILFYCLTRGTLWLLGKATRVVWRRSCRIGLWCSQHLYAALYGGGYILKRRYIAAALRRARKEKRYV